MNKYKTEQNRMKDMTLRTVSVQRQTTQRKNTRMVCQALLKHIEQFAGHDPLLGELDGVFCQRFADHLLRRVSTASAKTYMQKLSAILDYAVRQRYIPYNPMPSVRDLLPREAVKDPTYLTVNELLRLWQAACPDSETKAAFLFACFTGLRLSDIETLRWNEITQSSGTRYVDKVQVKTLRSVRIPLNGQSISILAKLQERDDGRVFHLKSRTAILKHLGRWAANAGISKDISFHASRHTFASNAVLAGVDIYTVSHLCGHAHVHTTERYAHIADQTLNEGILAIGEMLREASWK